MNEPWLPVLFTQSLTGTEDFVTDGDKLLEVIDLAWKSPDQTDFVLDEWQRWLIRHALERYPDDWPDERKRGQLRFQQVVISMGRQNGKSVLGAVFALYGLLMHGTGPEVVSVASTVPQAEIIYKRVKHVIDNNPTLKKRFKSTGTRGIRSKNDAKPGSYMVKAGAEDSLQGVTISLCLYDEIHITKPETWDAVVFGTSSPHQKGRMVLGITTAGDSNSVLLKRLYEIGRKAAAGDDDADERFGFFLWEAPEHLEVTDPQAIIMANPAIACGRFSIEDEVNKVRNMPENTARRYRLNQFVASEATWLSAGLWHRLDKQALPHTKNMVVAVDRAENWEYATITGAVKEGNKVYTQVLASIHNPDIAVLEATINVINRKYKPMKYLMDVAVLRELAYRLRDRRLPVEYLTAGQMQNVAATSYSLIANGQVVHASDPVVDKQVTKAVLHNSTDGGARVSRKHSAGAIDSLLATIMGIWGAETFKPSSPMLYIAS